MANRKKKEERLRKNPPPLPRKVVLMLKAKRLLGPWRTLRPGKSKTTDMVINRRNPQIECIKWIIPIRHSHDRRFIADESELEFPTDNVYFMNDFCYRRCTLEEGLKDLRAHYEV